MEVDQMEDLVPEIVEESFETTLIKPKDKLLHWLDTIEAHVENLRKATLLLEERRDSLFTSLDAIRNSELLLELHDTDRDDIERYADRVISRCSTIEVLVRTDRDSAQEDALAQVNRLIDSLVVTYKSDPLHSQIKCQAYMASCTSSMDDFTAADKEFENALLGCNLDDQKKIKKRLQGLLDYLERSGKIKNVSES